MAGKMSGVGYVVAVVSGVALWISISRISGFSEAWDSRLYYVWGIPIMMAVCFSLGIIFANKPWRWPLTIMISQALVAVFQNPLANLLPLGLIAFAVLSLPGLLSAYLGAFVRRTYQQK